MAKKKRRIWWFHVDEIEEAETWLGDMAAKGWHLSGSDAIFVHFTQGQPETVRYRCDIFSRKDGFEERIDLYTQTGWEYVASVGSSLHIFRAPATGAVPEIHTDPVEMAPTLNLLLRPYYMLGLSALAMFALCLIPLFIYGNVPLGLLVYADYLFILSLVPAISLMIIAGNGICRVVRKRKMLRRGSSFSHNKPYHYVFSRGWGTLFVLVLGLVLVAANAVNVFRSDHCSPLPQGELPVVRLSDIISHTEYIIIEPDDFELFNGCFTSSSLLVPWQWYSAEFAGQLAGGGSVSRTSLVFSSYRARTTGLADILARMLPSKFELRKSESYPGDLWIYQHGNVHEFILLKDKYVFYVVYNGLEPVEKLIGLVEDKIASLNK